jgi:rhamnosyltransferase
MTVSLATIHASDHRHALSHLNGCRLEQSAAIVVLFFPSNKAFHNLHQIIKQFGLVVGVVNGLDEGGWGRLNKECAKVSNLIIIDSGGNIGVAAALNAGASAVRQHGFVWVATFDQDSSIESSFAACVAKNMSAITHSENIALVTPVHVGRERANFVGYCPILRDHGTWAEIGSVITSGNIISLKAWEAIGGFREGLFIDFVDYDYCFRLRKAGFRLILLRQVMMKHDIGEAAYAEVMGLRIPLDGHGPNRYFYMVRNFLLILPANVFSEPWFFIRMAAALVIKVGLLLIFDDRRIAYARSVARGLGDGFQGRSGTACGHRAKM